MATGIFEDIDLGLDLEPEEAPGPTSALEVITSDPVTWSPRMSFEMAMGDDDTTLMERYDLTPEAYARTISHPAFRREVSTFIKDIRENGVTFRAKARVQAEEYLEVLDSMVTDQGISSATRLDAIKSIVKWAGLEPKPEAAGAQSNMPQFNIQINL